MISVVIPVRNRERLVKRTLTSLKEQTLAPDAVILVDNGSTDGTLDVLRQYPGAIVIEEPRPGATTARNAGLERVNSEYVLFFDSDDIMPPRHIEELTAALRAANMPEIGAFDMELINLDGTRSPKPFRHGDPMKMQIFHSILSTQRCVISTELARRVGGWNETLPVWDDLEFGVRLLASCARMTRLKISEPVHTYAQAESITGTDFASKAGKWEKSLDACADIVKGTKYERMINMRRAILAGMYRRENRPDLAKSIKLTPFQRLISRYVALGGRGVAYLA
ncbi:MAG: glycosyltransferase family 2 protein [Bacteroides sp.]|nr:glycosyltransferase family 2 protein [Bacteroides sp.]MCM1378570.1 glycosyltransferase family 2 protein [Bacteroides sp.]MCM1444871.1 glycosyltransferase family 2 protein [Prevotella sp.]